MQELYGPGYLAGYMNKEAARPANNQHRYRRGSSPTSRVTSETQITTADGRKMLVPTGSPEHREYKKRAESEYVTRLALKQKQREDSSHQPRKGMQQSAAEVLALQNRKGSGVIKTPTGNVQYLPGGGVVGTGKAGQAAYESAVQTSGRRVGGTEANPIMGSTSYVAPTPEAEPTKEQQYQDWIQTDKGKQYTNLMRKPTGNYTKTDDPVMNVRNIFNRQYMDPIRNKNLSPEQAKQYYRTHMNYLAGQHGLDKNQRNQLHTTMQNDIGLYGEAYNMQPSGFKNRPWSPRTQRFFDIGNEAYDYHRGAAGVNDLKFLPKHPISAASKTKAPQLGTGLNNKPAPKPIAPSGTDLKSRLNNRTGVHSNRPTTLSGNIQNRFKSRY